MKCTCNEHRKISYYKSINLLKKFRHTKIEIIRIPGFYNNGQPIFGKIVNEYKLAFFLHTKEQSLSLRFYCGDEQRDFTTITISKKEMLLMQNTFNWVYNNAR